MNREEREVLTERVTARLVAGLLQTESVEGRIRALLTGYGMEMFAARGRGDICVLSCTSPARCAAPAGATAMNQGRTTPYHLGTNTLAILVRERVCTIHRALGTAQMETGRLTNSSEPSTSSLWNAGSSRGRMEALKGLVLHPCRRFPPEGCRTCVQEGNKNSKAEVGNGRADGPFPSRRDGAGCS